MTIEQVREYLDDVLGEAEMCELNVTVRLYLDNDTQIEAWYDNDYDCFLWSNGNVGYDSLSDVIDDIVTYLIDHRLEVEEVEEV